ncbi:unnamed protein product [Clonostachys byssicola]|uniref:Uncharacterized protein n=1 Tax=Clonostachys byssicola TaxID=160290 RepID=A0A9N9U9M6_9HYPO|nr:unnamed protein product [Clonostachys byssicola]
MAQSLDPPAYTHTRPAALYHSCLLWGFEERTHLNNQHHNLGLGTTQDSIIAQASGESPLGQTTRPMHCWRPHLPPQNSPMSLAVQPSQSRLAWHVGSYQSERAASAAN